MIALQPSIRCIFLLIFLVSHVQGNAVSGFFGRGRNEIQRALMKSVPSDLHRRIGRASKQVAARFGPLCPPPGPVLMVRPRGGTLVCLSGVAVSCFVAKQFIERSEGAQRACFFWSKAGPIVAHYKWTQAWLKATNAPIEKRNTVYKSLHDRYCGPSLDLILELKGLYVKIGQVMSSRTDFLPIQYTRLFSTLQDSIPQWPVEEAIAVATGTLQAEKGLDFDDVFESIDEEALGCASIGQVHRAVLKEEYINSDPTYNGGRQVAIKIMHPDAKQRFACDFQVFKWLTRVAMPGWQDLLMELEKRLMTEFDYRNEGWNQVTIRDNLLKSPYRRRVAVPQTHMELTCKHMLVMEMLEGKKLKDSLEEKLARVIGGDKEKASKFLAQRQLEIMGGDDTGVKPPQQKTNMFQLLNLHGISGMYRAWKAFKLYRQVHDYIDLLIDVHGHQIFRDACFSADPHPGNIMELSNGKLGLIDFGQTKKLTDTERLAYAQIVADLGNKAPAPKIADSMRKAGFTMRDNNDDETMAQYAILVFDSDHIGLEKGFSTPQHYFASLMQKNPIQIPDSAIMVGRASILFRGAGSALNYRVKTADHWEKPATEALKEKVTDAK